MVHLTFAFLCKAWKRQWFGRYFLHEAAEGHRMAFPIPPPSSYFTDKKRTEGECCVFQPANTCLPMPWHGQKQWKSRKNHEKSIVNRLLGVTPNRWPTNIFSQISLWALHEPLVRMMKKVLFHDFWMFFIVFNHASACTSMPSLVEIHNRWIHKILELGGS